jgi:hypothetical protein
VAFICPYSGGFKYQGDLDVTFSWIDHTCGLNIMGYNQIPGGEGDMTAGRCTKGDNFCTKDFRVGS